MSQPQWYQPPRAGGPDAQAYPPGSGETSPAGFGIRAGARFVDVIAGMGVGFVGGALGATITVALSGALGPGMNRGMSAVSFALSMLGSLSYHVLCEGLGGATIGKLVCGLRVLREDNSRCTLGGALVRGLAYYIDAFFFGLVAYSVMSKSPRKQRLGDQWGKTVVVHASSVPASSARSPVLGILVGLLVWAFCVVLGTVARDL